MVCSARLWQRSHEPPIQCEETPQDDVPVSLTRTRTRSENTFSAASRRGSHRLDRPFGTAGEPLVPRSRHPFPLPSSDASLAHAPPRSNAHRLLTGKPGKRLRSRLRLRSAAAQQKSKRHRALRPFAHDLSLLLLSESSSSCRLRRPPSFPAGSLGLGFPRPKPSPARPALRSRLVDRHKENVLFSEKILIVSQ